MKSIPSSVWFLGSLLLGAFFIGILVVNTDNQIRENVDLPITLVEYFDYQCSHCVDFQSEVLALEERFGEDLEVIPKHFPLPVGPNSIVLAHGAEAAREQGKFIEYHEEVLSRMELVFAGTLNGDEVTPEKVAEFLELDMEKFATDIQSESIIARVDADKKEGADLGVSGTPTVFLEGQRTNSVDLASTIEKLINLAKENEGN